MPYRGGQDAVATLAMRHRDTQDDGATPSMLYRGGQDGGATSALRRRGAQDAVATPPMPYRGGQDGVLTTSTHKSWGQILVATTRGYPSWAWAVSWSTAGDKSHLRESGCIPPRQQGVPRPGSISGCFSKARKISGSFSQGLERGGQGWEALDADENISRQDARSQRKRSFAACAGAGRVLSCRAVRGARSTAARPEG